MEIEGIIDTAARKVTRENEAYARVVIKARVFLVFDPELIEIAMTNVGTHVRVGYSFFKNNTDEKATNLYILTRITPE